MASRFIDEFKEQTKNTILEHMDRMAVNNTVYSTHMKGYEPYLKEKNIIVYLHDISMVVVCFDLCGRIEEIADEAIRQIVMMLTHQNTILIRALERVLYGNYQRPSN